MKPLFSYIQEARGVVTGSDNWSDLVDYIVSNCVFDDDGDFIVQTNLPPWMGSCVIRRVDWVPGGIAAYADEEAMLIDDKMEVTIKVSDAAMSNTSKFKVTLEHEFQHAFDHWISRFRKGKGSFIGDDYCIPVGYEGPEFDNIDFWDIYQNPSNCYFDHMFYLLRESTYWFDESESNAFLREFSLYLNSCASKGDTFDWEDLYKDPNNTGAQPLIGIMLIHCVLDHPEKFTGVDKNELGWDYVMGGMNHVWAPKVMGKTYPGEDAMSFCRVLQDILKRKAGKLLKRYKRVAKDSGLKFINTPDWFK